MQKACLFIILGKCATPDYLSNLETLGLESLFDRRNVLFKEFAAKIFKHPVHGKMFQRNEGRKPRGGRQVIVPVGKSARYNKSAIPSLAKLLNDQ